MPEPGGAPEQSAERAALAALAGLPSVVGVSQEGVELRLEPRDLDGDHLTVLAPRLGLVGVETLTVRFVVDSAPWRIAFELRQATYHSFDQALARLRMRSAERGEVERISRREPVRAPGRLEVLQARNVIPGNEYAITIEERSVSGLRFTCEWDVSEGDTFRISAMVEGARYAVRATAVNVTRGPFGRRVVGARVG